MLQLPTLDDIAAEESRRGLRRIDASVAPEWFHTYQLAAWMSRAVDVAAIAGFQSGKTAEEVWWLLREIQRCAPFIAWLGEPGKAIFAGPTLTLMESQAIPAFKEVFEEKYQLGRLTQGTKPKFTFSRDGLKRLLGFSSTPVTVYFAYTNDSSNLESMTACCGVWDEAGQKENKRASFEAFDRRLNIGRSTTFRQIRDWLEEDEARLQSFEWWLDTYYAKEGPDAVFGRRFWGTTPYEWNWFKTEIYDKAKSGLQGYELFNFPTWANPRNSKAKSREARRHMPRWKWRMMHLGVYTKPAGVVYECFNRKVHTVKRFRIPDDWQRAQGVDFGTLNTASVWAAQDPDTGTWYVYSSYLEANLTEEEHVTNWRRRNGKKKGKSVDPWAWGGKGDKGEDSWRNAFGNVGYAIHQPPVRAIDKGIECAFGMLKERKIVIFDDLTFLIEGEGSNPGIENYTYGLDEEGEPDQDPAKIVNKAKAHRPDAFRYLCCGLELGEQGPKYIGRTHGQTDDEFGGNAGGRVEAGVRETHASLRREPSGLGSGRVSEGRRSMARAQRATRRDH